MSRWPEDVKISHLHLIIAADNDSKINFIMEKVLLSASAGLLSSRVQDGTLEAMLKGNRFSYNFTKNVQHQQMACK